MRQSIREMAKNAALAGAALAMTLAVAPAWADHDDDKHGRRKSGKIAAAGPANPAYERDCGACHWAYFPGLLPARSWEKILARPDHFGEQLPYSAQDLAPIRQYLLANAADESGNKRSRKIMKGVGSATPDRVTELGYLRDKHRKVGAEVFARASVKGFGNCLACHPGAKNGDFDDDNVVIPR